MDELLRKIFHISPKIGYIDPMFKEANVNLPISRIIIGDGCLYSLYSLFFLVLSVSSSHCNMYGD